MTPRRLAGQPYQLITLEEAEEILAPHRDLLNRCIQHGWDVWKSDYAHKHHILQARARAAVVFDEIVDKALVEFASHPDVIMKRTASTLMLYIGKSIVLRFKKIRKNGRCSNILTRQQILFRAQEIVQLRLPEMEKGTLVHAGYQLDDLQQEIQRKSVVCQFNNSVIWQMSLAVEHAAVVEYTPQQAVPVVSAEPRFEPKPELLPAAAAVKTSGEDR
jgi:hypothetical protein